MSDYEQEDESPDVYSDLGSAQEESEDMQNREFNGQARDRAPAGNRRGFGHLWLISYSDFMTILMIFFLGMYGYTVLAKAALLKQNKITYTEFSKKISELKGKLGEQIEIKEDISKVTMNLPEEILFPSGKAVLTTPAVSTLQEFARSLKQVDGDIVVEGHTDNVPVKAGHYRSNWELSAARAFAVIEALTNSGVAPERLAAWGFGENRPLASNADVEGRAKNRRIEIVLLKKSEQKGK